jgi:hypothetical protein
MSDAPSADSSPSADSNAQILTVLGEALDLLAGIEARQKVLAREISHLRASVEDRSQDEIREELRSLFEKNLSEERDRILSRVSLLSSLPPSAGTEPAGDADA